MNIRIIGAGIAGLTCALAFAKRGCRVSVFERNATAGAGCSWYAGGMLAPWCEMESAEPLVVSMGQESLAFWKSEFSGTCSKGSLVLAPPRDQPDLKRFARRTTDHQWLDGNALAALEPDLAGRFPQALYFEQEAHLDPRQAVKALSLRLADEFHVTFHYGASVEPEDDPSYVWTIDSRGYDGRDGLADLRGVKGEMLVLRTSEVQLSRPVRLVHPRYPVYIVPRADHQFMIGATMIETSERKRITARSMMELLNAAYTVHPAFGEAEIVETGSDLRPSFGDNLPRIRSRCDKVLQVNGLYRHGFLLAPALARRAAEFALDGHVDRAVMDDAP